MHCYAKFIWITNVPGVIKLSFIDMHVKSVLLGEKCSSKTYCCATRHIYRADYLMSSEAPLSLVEGAVPVIFWQGTAASDLGRQVHMLKAKQENMFHFWLWRTVEGKLLWQLLTTHKPRLSASSAHSCCFNCIRIVCSSSLANWFCASCEDSQLHRNHDQTVAYVCEFVYEWCGCTFSVKLSAPNV